MKPFKVSLKELIILIVLSAPIGIFIFLNNYNKINYEVKALRGLAVTENFCENYNYQKIHLIKDDEVDLVLKNYKSSQSSYSKLVGKIKISTTDSAYLIAIKGIARNEEEMGEVANKILEELLELEYLRFNNIYKGVTLHCKSGDFSVFRAVPLKKINNEFSATRSYKNLHLGLLLILPLSIIYLLFIALKYIRKISIKK